MLDVMEVTADWNDEGQRLIERCPGWKLEEVEQREDLETVTEDRKLVGLREEDAIDDFLWPQGKIWKDKFYIDVVVESF